ncbi:hypothetical protein AAFF_G00183810 [Aldrovandia affinis]|uniref:Uncharacterized protein n=1 Tax=Aldrovandia affinis TaxID=143900 RepID=A0AAD7RK74_9TELE|nr:hypothetical protein AAFF_G00183810 [Aldrovandia affinis]
MASCSQNSTEASGLLPELSFLLALLEPAAKHKQWESSRGPNPDESGQKPQPCSPHSLRTFLGSETAFWRSSISLAQRSTRNTGQKPAP